MNSNPRITTYVSSTKDENSAAKLSPIFEPTRAPLCTGSFANTSNARSSEMSPISFICNSLLTDYSTTTPTSLKKCSTGCSRPRPLPGGRKLNLTWTFSPSAASSLSRTTFISTKASTSLLALTKCLLPAGLNF